MQTGVGERAWCVVVPHHPRSAAVARQRLAADLDGLDEALVSDVTVVVSELVGNAVRHARPLPGGVLRVAWQVTPDGVEVRVTDGGSPRRPVRQNLDPDSVDGRGLAIVDALAHRWGVVRDGLGQCVWALCIG